MGEIELKAPQKTPRVLIEPYATWNRRIGPFSIATFVLMIVTIFYHPLWLSLLTGVLIFINVVIDLWILWLNERKKYRLRHPK
ncbi:hypothetical protein FD14_GL000430 [Secundilactobacillus similis DSM 23365 = JCM 2765]|uniref:Uncharacterized protein n=1 Tax=Secundilactobacillus similis DSM 23365 = JCM 2765 TaxID=1423804 RepID=A0A0R2F9D7_9LACO|nr:hypothetical protein FD14_GL000430 [Secundilactobacillus similis DSM 23365 = JCM 2765]